MDRHRHWEHVYDTKGEQDVSWFETFPTISIRLMEAAGLTNDLCVLDVGGGDSHLIDALVARGLSCLAVLDVSGTALDRAKARLGPQSTVPTWIEADVLQDWTLKPMDVWHDRAVFHFLTRPVERDRYRQHLYRTLKGGGTAIVATFAEDGPKTCSGLSVSRYAPRELAEALGPGVTLIESVRHVHVTPWNTQQPFHYCRFRRSDEDSEPRRD